MAIVIQEEKTSGGWFGFSVLMLVLIVIGIALYYLFFVQPELLTTGTAKNFETIEEFSQMNFDPKQVIESDFFKSQKQFMPSTPVSNPGNPRPFGMQ